MTLRSFVGGNNFKVVYEEAKSLGKEFGLTLLSVSRGKRIVCESAFAQTVSAMLKEADGQTSTYLNRTKKVKPVEGRFEVFYDEAKSLGEEFALILLAVPLEKRDSVESVFVQAAIAILNEGDPQTYTDLNRNEKETVENRTDIPPDETEAKEGDPRYTDASFLW